MVAAANLLLLHGATQMYQALAPSGAGRHAGPARLVTWPGWLPTSPSSGCPDSQRWRTVFWLTIAFYALASLANDHANILSLLITLLIGSAIGSGLRYAFGSSIRASVGRRRSPRRSASSGAPVVGDPADRDSSTETRRYAATHARTAAGWTSRSSTGTSRRRTCSTGCTAGCG